MRPTSCLLLLLLAWSAAAAQQATHVSESVVGTFLKKHCIQCHGPKKTKGQLRFDELSKSIDTNDVAQRWQDVLDVLNAGEMPPEDEAQPTTAELATVLDSLTNTILDARKRLTDHGGEIALRRLNRREYSASIRHLFGFAPDQQKLPGDDGVEPFDTVGSQQYFTSSHFDHYLKLGREAVQAGFTWAVHNRAMKTSRQQNEARLNRQIREKLAELDAKMAMKKAGKTWQEMGFADAGEAKIIFNQFDNRAGGRRRYLQYPRVDEGVYFCDAVTGSKFQGYNQHHVDPRATYVIRVHGGIHGSPPDIRHFLRIDADHRTIGVLKIRGSDQAPETVELSYQPHFHNPHLHLRIRENREEELGLSTYLRLLGQDKRLKPGEGAAIWVDWIEVEGPHYPAERSFFDKLLMPKAPAAGTRARPKWSDDQAPELIRKFAFEAFRRREASPDFLAGLQGHFQKQRAAGKNFEAAMVETLAVVLASPGFLYLHEQGPENRPGKQLAPREIAIRLAYFLWGAPPDDQLYEAAASGQLTTPEQLRVQVNRMLDAPESHGFAEGFASQWADLDRFDAVTVDDRQFPRFNDGLRFSAKQEVIAFYAHLIKENLPVRNLIKSDLAMLNSHLAEHYGLPSPGTDKLQPVALPAGSSRGGFLTQTAFLTTGSTGERSSPVIRGALVMEKLLHDPPAPPPPNVPELGAGIRKASTNRELVKRHQDQPQCASCHKKMDVIGFGLENFDAIGKWRQTETVGRKQVPIVAAGTLPDGAAFTDVASLQEVLLTHEDDLARGMVESVLAYALGRTIEFSDGDDVDQVLKQIKPGAYGFRDMLHAIAASPLFSQH